MFVQVSFYFVYQLTPVIRHCILHMNIEHFLLQCNPHQYSFFNFEFNLGPESSYLLFPFSIASNFTFDCVLQLNRLSSTIVRCVIFLFARFLHLCVFPLRFSLSFESPILVCLLLRCVYLKTRTRILNVACFRFSPILSFLFLTYATEETFLDD